MNNQWKDDLRDRMEWHKEPTPEGLWDDIEQFLLVDNSVPTMPPKHSIPLWIVRGGAAAAVALVLLIIGLYFLNDDGEELQMAEQKRREHPIPDTSPSVTEPTTKTEPPEKTEPAIKPMPTNKIGSASKIEGTLLASATEKSKTIAEKVPPIGEKPKPPIAEKASTVDETKATETEMSVTENRSENNLDESQQQHPVSDGKQPGFSTNGTPGFQRTTHNRNHRRPKWQTDLYASNMPSGTTSTHNGYGSFVPYELNTEEFVLASVEQSEPPSDARGLSEYQHVYTDIKHSQPITFGVSVKYRWDERWSLTSGFTYTLLSSELYSGSKTDNHYHHSLQTLHYVGVPLNVNYTVWENNKISTYISGGGLVEKNLSGSLKTDFVIGDQLETQNRQDILVKPLQWSVNSAVGIQYQLDRHIGFYAEPGVSYHFKNSSKVETIYREKPLNFNIRLGLRFSLNER